MSHRTSGPAAPASRDPKRASPGIPTRLPVLPVRDVVLFPGVEEQLRVGRESSRRLLEDSLPHSQVIAIFTQKYDRDNNPPPQSLCRVGVVAQVTKLYRFDDGRMGVTVVPMERAVVSRVVAQKPFLQADTAVLASVPPAKPSQQWEATVQELRDVTRRLFAFRADEVSERRRARLDELSNAGELADFVASGLALDLAAKQDLLEELDVARRVRAVLAQAASELEVARLREKIRRDTEAHFTEGQRRAFLQEQLRTIRKELGETLSEGEQQAAELRRRFAPAELSPPAREQFERELKRLSLLRAASAEFPLLVDYAETLGEMPWNRTTVDNLDLVHAQAVLDRNHFDLVTVKQRIIEHLAVRKKNPSGRFPVLCLLGPPGVGKFSLSRTIAEALGRKVACIRLDGLQEEAVLIGERRTQPGAAIGLPLAELRRTGVSNPVFVLEGIDRLGLDFHGDPVSALLELIDPRRNGEFVDRFLNVPFDLSRVLFVATAQYADDIPAAIRDRLELVRIPGYSDDDKLAIARAYLVPRQIAEHGLAVEQCRFDDDALRGLVSDYTREAGVRVLDRHIGALCRAAVATLATNGKSHDIVVKRDTVEQVLGPPRFLRETRLTTPSPGVVTGLAWTNIGGEIMHIEALRYRGKGYIQLTGQIGSVMRESAQAALSLLKSRAKPLGIDGDELLDYDIHVHVPAGAVPKDGPSAGVAIFTAIVSLWTERTVRPDVAMTGEITLRGLVLPIGGLKEKILAAQRAGIPSVILPKQNEKDLVDLPASVREQMRFIAVETVDEVLAAAVNPAPAKPKARRSSRAPKTKK